MSKITLKLPKLAVSMREGVIIEWLVSSGSNVLPGQPLYVLESEKTSFEVESPFAGILTILCEVGGTHAVGTPVAEIVAATDSIHFRQD